MMHNPEALLRADLATARTKENQYQASKAGKATAVDQQQSVDDNARAFITKAKDVLKPHLGSQWSPAWAQGGFVNPSLRVPGTIAARMELVKQLQTYFAANPTRQNEPLGVTAVLAGTLYDEFTSAVSTVNACNGDVQNKRAARDAAVEALDNRMRGVIAEFAQLVGPLDGRWLDLGLNRPGANETPDTPDFTLESGAPGHLVVNVGSTLRMQSIRVWKQQVGVDAEPVFAGTFQDRRIDLNTFTSGSKVQVQVSAVNDGGESPRSTVVEKVVP
jgi:hypothetical protein